MRESNSNEMASLQPDWVRPLLSFREKRKKRFAKRKNRRSRRRKEWKREKGRKGIERTKRGKRKKRRKRRERRERNRAGDSRGGIIEISAILTETEVKVGEVRICILFFSII